MRRIVGNTRNFCHNLNSAQIQQKQWVLSSTAVTLPIERLLSTNSVVRSPCLQLQVENVGVAQVRKYAPTSPALPACWNCNKFMGGKNRIICENCGYLQDVDVHMNYFDLMDFPMGFGLEPQELTKRYRRLQTIVHPDKYSNKTSREQTNSADWSSLINKAYKTLSVPIKRGQYILRINGMQVPEDNSALNKEFLMEMLERNEEVEEANSQSTLDALNERLSQELQQKISELNAHFEINALEAAKSVLVEMKYLLSMQQNIKNKLQKLLEN